MALLWMLNQSDARTSVVEIAEKSGLAAGHLVSAAAELVDAGLLVADSDE
jgi:aminopeptidase-like protein